MGEVRQKLIIALTASIITFIISGLGAFDGVDHLLTDYLYQKPGTINNNIIIIGIDEKTLSEYGSYENIDRSHYAGLLDYLYEDREYAPSVCAFDMIFQGKKSTESDKAFAIAAQEAGSVICAENIVYKKNVEETDSGLKYVNSMYVDRIEQPYEELKEHVRMGFANTILDEEDSRIRQFYLALPGKDGNENSLPLEMAYQLEEKGLASVSIPNENINKKLIIKYSAKHGDYEVLSMSDVLEHKIPKQIFKDSVVLVGAYAPAMMDAYSTPVDYKHQLYGVEIHANILQSIIDGRYMIPASKWTYSIVYALVVFALVVIAQFIPLLASLLISIAVAIVGLFVGTYYSNKNIFIPILPFLICLLLSYLVTLVKNYFLELIKRRKAVNALKKYISPQIVEELAKKNDYKVELGGQKRSIAVMFVDIRGFTPLSECLEPEQVVLILNEYLSLTTEAVFKNQGTLDKFIGDATMAVFNAPYDLEDYIFKAVCAAENIVSKGDEISQKAYELTGKRVSFGIGINCGEAVVGNIGCDFRMDYTAIGDVVNTAARLESKAEAGQILLSPTVVESLGSRISTNKVGVMQLKGKAEPLTVYELIEINNGK